jgi:cytochrome P450
MSSVIDDALTSEAFFQSPWETYERLRNVAPVYWCEPWQQWLVSRYDDVVHILRNPGLFSNHGFEQAFLRKLPGSLSDDFPNIDRHYNTLVVSNSNPPDHTRLRKHLQPIFGPRKMKHLEADVGVLVDGFLDPLGEHGGVDWVEQFAFPLPSTVIAVILGAPASDRERFQRWSSSMSAFLGSGSPQIDLARRNDASIADFRAYMEELAQTRTGRDAPTVLDALLAARDEGALTHDELISTCMTLLQGGFETTANLLSNAVVCLMTHPEQWGRLKADPSLASAAVEETLRFNGPVQAIRRIARENVIIGDTEIAAGSLVICLIGSANRDETQFPNPATFDIYRDPARHLGFGLGIHHCVGAPLSRMEATATLEALASRYGGTRLAEGFEMSYRKNVKFRGPERLLVELRHAS